MTLDIQQIKKHLGSLAREEREKLFKAGKKETLIEIIEFFLEYNVIIAPQEVQNKRNKLELQRLEKQGHRFLLKDDDFVSGITQIYTIQTKEISRSSKKYVDCSKLVRISNPYVHIGGANPLTISKYDKKTGLFSTNRKTIFADLGNPYDKMRDPSKLEPLDLDLIEFGA